LIKTIEADVGLVKQEICSRHEVMHVGKNDLWFFNEDLVGGRARVTTEVISPFLNFGPGASPQGYKVKILVADRLRDWA